MLGSLRKQLTLSQVPFQTATLARFAASTGVVGSFVWLLAQDLIHPIFVYLLELYLTF